MTYRPLPRSPRRGCLRGCAGCLLHHPLTVGLTVVALILWLNQLVRGAIALAAGQPPDLLAVILATLLLILAQLGPPPGTVGRARRWISVRLPSVF